MKNLMRNEWLDWCMTRALHLNEDFSETPKKQNIYNWMTLALSYPKDIDKSFLISGIYVYMSGKEDALSPNMRLNSEDVISIPSSETNSSSNDDKNNIFMNEK